MTIQINGKSTEVGAATVAAMLEEVGIAPTRSGIAVAVDGAIVPRPAWPSTALAEGQRVEIVTARQGG